jgi:hypothetical protein
MKVEIRGLEDVQDLLREIGNQAPYVMARTISRTAVKVKEEEVDEMRKVFDRPTPYTLSGVYAKTASKSDLTARVWLKEMAGKGIAAVDFLWPQVHGGDRQLKRFEKALQYAGVLPRGYYCVPGGAAKKDQYGNMEKSQIVQIISYFQGFGEQGYRANMTAQRKKKLAKGTKTTRGYAYFAIQPGKHLHPGIYQRTSFAWGSSPKPVLIFVKKTRYEKRFDFYQVGQDTVDRVWQDEFYMAFDDVVRARK